MFIKSVPYVLIFFLKLLFLKSLYKTITSYLYTYNLSGLHFRISIKYFCYTTTYLLKKILLAIIY